MSDGLWILLTGLAWTLAHVIPGRRRYVSYWTRNDSGSEAFWSSPYPPGPDQVPRTYALIFNLSVGVGLLGVIAGAVKLIGDMSSA